MWKFYMFCTFYTVNKKKLRAFNDNLAAST